MTHHIKKLLVFILAIGFILPFNANATNGYFQIGYGPRMLAVAGVGTALPQDSMAASMNPAGQAIVGKRLDFSMKYFAPIRSANSQFGGGPLRSKSKSELFLIPNFGYTRPLNDKMTIGIVAYANGGMNTDFAKDNGGVNLFGNNQSHLGVDLAQLIIAPTFTYKIADGQYLGISPLIGVQLFKANGLQNFCALKLTGCVGGVGSPTANKGLTNQGREYSYGAGVRVGWLGQLTKNITAGAAFASKVYMTDFVDYDQLFADGGSFDIPSNFSVGIAIKAMPKVTVAFDIQGIFYSDVDAIANRGPTVLGANVFAQGQGFLGQSNGLGFGWNDMYVYKLGMVYEHDREWTWRAGVSHTDQPIEGNQTAFNILAPAVVETHATIGFSYRPKGDDHRVWTLTYMHAFSNTVTGQFPVAFGGTPGTKQTRLEMYQDAFDMGFTWEF